MENSETHISPKHNKEFKNFVLKLLCFGNIESKNFVLKLLCFAAFYPENGPIRVYYAKTVSLKMLQVVSKVAPRSPLNIG